jgi:hypothetical protein
MTGSAACPDQVASTLAAQAGALASAAAFVTQAAMTGLTIAVSGEQITILVTRPPAPAARIAAVTALAAVIGAPAPACTTVGIWTHISADGTINGHPARVWASIEPEDPAA